MDWFKPELMWLVLGVLLLVLEFTIPGVILVFFGVGGLLTALFIWIGVLDSLTAQVLFFLASSLLLLFALRRFLRRQFAGIVRRQADYVDDEEFVGKTARVTQRIVPNSSEGRIEFEGAEWKAIARETITVGSLVKIRQKDNITFEVEPVTQNGEG